MAKKSKVETHLAVDFDIEMLDTIRQCVNYLEQNSGLRAHTQRCKLRSVETGFGSAVDLIVPVTLKHPALAHEIEAEVVFDITDYNKF